jgi:hypothetical protein
MQINFKQKQVQEKEHDVRMLMLYMMNLVVDDKERKKNAQKGVFIVEDLGSNGKISKSM